MKVKNFNELSDAVYSAVDHNLPHIKEVLVGDTFNPSSTVIELDMRRLLHDAVISRLSEMGAVNNNPFNIDGYKNGLHIDFSELNIRFENGRLVFYTTRKEENL